MRSDNGPPFAPLAVHGLSSLAAGWIQLEICPERIEPRHPEQNGRHDEDAQNLEAADGVAAGADDAGATEGL